MNSFDTVLNACNYLLNNYPEASKVKSYVDSRINADSQTKFNFGFLPNNNQLSLLSSIVGDNALIESQVIRKESQIIETAQSVTTFKKSNLDNYNLVFPYKDAYGNTIAIVGRTLLSDKEREDLSLPKYMNTVFYKGDHVFGLSEAKSSIIENDSVVIVEGQFDCIKAHESGFKNIVAVGSSSLAIQQLLILLRYTDNIIIMFDNDDGGEKGRDRINKKYNNIAKIKQAYLPNGYNDVYDFFVENDVSSFNRLLD